MRACLAATHIPDVGFSGLCVRSLTTTARYIHVCQEACVCRCMHGQHNYNHRLLMLTKACSNAKLSFLPACHWADLPAVLAPADDGCCCCCGCSCCGCCCVCGGGAAGLGALLLLLWPAESAGSHSSSKSGSCRVTGSVRERAHTQRSLGQPAATCTHHSSLVPFGLDFEQSFVVTRW